MATKSFPKNAGTLSFLKNFPAQTLCFFARVMDGPADDDHVVPPDAPPSVGLELRKMLDVDKPERKKRGTGIVT